MEKFIILYIFFIFSVANFLAYVLTYRNFWVQKLTEANFDKKTLSSLNLFISRLQKRSHENDFAFVFYIFLHDLMIMSEQKTLADSRSYREVVGELFALFSYRKV